MNQQNQVELVGTLAADPISNVYEKGHRVLLRLATNETGKPGAQTTWHNVVAWDDLADNAAGCLTKGSHVKVTGRIVYRNYKGKDGVERLGVDIRASNLEKLDP